MSAEDITTFASPTRSPSPSGTVSTYRVFRSRWPSDLDAADRGLLRSCRGFSRDVVQNHLLQVVLSMVAMEPPAGPGLIINDRKADVFRAMPDADPA